MLFYGFNWSILKVFSPQLVILKLINDGVRQYGKIIKVPFIVGVGTRCVFLESTQH